MSPSEKTRVQIQGILLSEVERTRLLFLQNSTDDEAREEFEQALDRLKDFALYGKLPDFRSREEIEQTTEVALAASASTGFH